MYNLEKIEAAAIAYHGDQMYGKLPYRVHIEAVVAAVGRFVTEEMLFWASCTRSEMVAAAWFHDVLEDTICTRVRALEILGDSTEAAVWSVTDIEGSSRNLRKWGTATNPGPMRKMKNSQFGLLLKLMDRIANVEHSIKTESRMLGVYRKEHPDFVRSLYKPDTPIESVWGYLAMQLSETPKVRIGEFKMISADEARKNAQAYHTKRDNDALHALHLTIEEESKKGYTVVYPEDELSDEVIARLKDLRYTLDFDEDGPSISWPLKGD